VAKEINDFCKLLTFEESDRPAIGFRNALELFPRLRSAEEKSPVGVIKGTHRGRKLSLATRVAVSLIRWAMGDGKRID